MRPPDDIGVFFFGDSICIGQYVSIHKGWVTRISAALTEFGVEIGRTISVTNVSSSGRITREALERMPYEIQSQKPDVVLVQFGMNDCNYWESDNGLPRVSPKAFAANLEEIVDRLTAAGAKAVLLITNHLTARTTQSMRGCDISYQESNERYNELIRDVAANAADHVTLIDIEIVFKNYIKGDSERLHELLLPAPDSLHLSEKGHNIYYDAVLPLLKETVTDMVGSMHV